MGREGRCHTTGTALVIQQAGEKCSGDPFCSVLCLVINLVFRETLGGTWRGVSCYLGAFNHQDSLVPRWVGQCCKSSWVKHDPTLGKAHLSSPYLLSPLPRG